MSAKYLTFSDWLMCARARAKIKQGDLADVVGCSRVWISMIENGHRDPSPRLLSSIEAAVGQTYTGRGLS